MANPSNNPQPSEVDTEGLGASSEDLRDDLKPLLTAFFHRQNDLSDGEKQAAIQNIDVLIADIDQANDLSVMIRINNALDSGVSRDEEIRTIIQPFIISMSDQAQRLAECACTTTDHEMLQDGHTFKIMTQNEQVLEQTIDWLLENNISFMVDGNGTLYTQCPEDKAERLALALTHINALNGTMSPAAVTEAAKRTGVKTMAKPFKAGDRVKHARHGIGTVSKVLEGKISAVKWDKKPTSLKEGMIGGLMSIEPTFVASRQRDENQTDFARLMELAGIDMSSPGDMDDDHASSVLGGGMSPGMHDEMGGMDDMHEPAHEPMGMPGMGMGGDMEDDMDDMPEPLEIAAPAPMSPPPMGGPMGSPMGGASMMGEGGDSPEFGQAVDHLEQAIALVSKLRVNEYNRFLSKVNSFADQARTVGSQLVVPLTETKGKSRK